MMKNATITHLFSRNHKPPIVLHQPLKYKGISPDPHSNEGDLSRSGMSKKICHQQTTSDYEVPWNPIKVPCFRTPTCWAVLTIKLPTVKPLRCETLPSLPSNLNLEPQTTSLKWMEMVKQPTISYVKVGNHPMETTIYINGWPWGSRNRFFCPQVVFPAFLFTKQYGLLSLLSLRSFPPPFHDQSSTGTGCCWHKKYEC